MATEPVTLASIKQDLRLDASATDDDARLARLITAARRAVERKTGRTMVGTDATMTGDDLAMGCQAISLIVATWYALPEGVSVDGRAGAAELPLGVSWIIESLKDWAVE
ncbi:head-tail connector protein [Sphingomonas sp. 2378]|uniref:head-tail connector protein n=1 Tax=Sphingomonas sp. 2378 TaxID=1219748 RepID=UPI00311AF4E2